MKKFLVLFTGALLFVSCLGVETETTFNRDGSGTMSLTYKISNDLMQMGEDGAKESGVELPFDKEALEDSLEGADGVTLQSVETWTDEDATYLKANVSFTDVAAFYDLDEYDDMAAGLTREGGDFVYRQLIAPGSGEMSSDDEASMAMMAPYYEGYFVTHIVHAPSRIKSHNLGELSNGGKTLTFNMPMLDVQTAPEEIYLVIRW